jgi:hypothetical protein
VPAAQPDRMFGGRITSANWAGRAGFSDFTDSESVLTLAHAVQSPELFTQVQEERLW